jgi:hypothetical protein
VASSPFRDLFICAKELFVEANRGLVRRIRRCWPDNGRLGRFQPNSISVRSSDRLGSGAAFGTGVVPVEFPFYAYVNTIWNICGGMRPSRQRGAGGAAPYGPERDGRDLAEAGRRGGPNRRTAPPLGFYCFSGMCCVFFREAKPDLRHVQQTALFAGFLAVRANSAHSCPKRRYFSAVLIRECPTRLCNAVGPMGFRAPVGGQAIAL